MGSLNIPWWVWLVAVILILAIWRPGPRTLATLRIIMAAILFLILLFLLLSPFLIFAVATYWEDWQTGLAFAGLWLLVIGFFGLVSMFVDMVNRLFDCVMRGPDSRQ